VEQPWGYLNLSYLVSYIFCVVINIIDDIVYLDYYYFLMLFVHFTYNINFFWNFWYLWVLKFKVLVYLSPHQHHHHHNGHKCFSGTWLDYIKHVQIFIFLLSSTEYHIPCTAWWLCHHRKHAKNGIHCGL